MAAPAVLPAGRWRSDLFVILVNATLPSLVVVLSLWPLAQQTGWRNYWFDDRYLYDQAATLQERVGLQGDDPHELDAVRDRMPLYPLLLRALRSLSWYTNIPVPAWSVFINILAQAASAGVLYSLVFRAAVDRRLALTAALVWPWLPGVLPYTLAQMPEAVSTGLWLSACLGIVSVSRVPAPGAAATVTGVSGLLLGVATLFKPVFCYFSLPALVLLWMTSRHRPRWRYGILIAFLVPFISLIYLWCIRNNSLWGRLTLTPNGSAHVANARDAMAPELGLPPNSPGLPRADLEWRAAGVDPANLAERSAYRGRLAWAELQGRFPDVLWVALKSLVKLHGSTGVGALMTMSGGSLAVDVHDHQPQPWSTGERAWGWTVLQAFSVAVLVVVYVLSVAGLYYLRRCRWLFWWASFTVVYFVMLSIPFGSTRYRYPAMPAYAVLAAAGLSFLRQRWPRRDDA